MNNSRGRLQLLKKSRKRERNKRPLHNPKSVRESTSTSEHNTSLTEVMNFSFPQDLDLTQNTFFQEKVKVLAERQMRGLV